MSYWSGSLRPNTSATSVLLDEYAVGDRRRHWNIEVSDDWVDPMVVEYLMAELEHDGHRFYAMDDDQAMVLFFLDDVAANRLNELAGHALIAPAHELSNEI